MTLCSYIARTWTETSQPANENVKCKNRANCFMTLTKTPMLTSPSLVVGRPALEKVV